MSERRSRRTRGERPELVPPKSDEEPDLDDDYVDENGNKIDLGAVRGRRKRGQGNKASNGMARKGSSSSLSLMSDKNSQDEEKLPKKKPGRPRGRPPKRRGRPPKHAKPGPSPQSSVTSSPSIDDGDNDDDTMDTGSIDLDQSNHSNGSTNSKDGDDEQDDDSGDNSDDAERDTEDNAPKEALIVKKRGPGRPRKKDSDQIPEKIPGRTRKKVLEKEVLTVKKRGPGRPRKIVSEKVPEKVPEKEASTVKKRGPGRPRKKDSEKVPEKIPGRTRKKVLEKEVLIVKKRGPGRPRKKVSEKVAEPESSSDSRQSLANGSSSSDSSDTSSPPSPVVIVRKKVAESKKSSNDSEIVPSAQSDNSDESTTSTPSPVDTNTEVVPNAQADSSDDQKIAPHARHLYKKCEWCGEMIHNRGVKKHRKLCEKSPRNLAKKNKKLALENEQGETKIGKKRRLSEKGGNAISTDDDESLVDDEGTAKTNNNLSSQPSNSLPPKRKRRKNKSCDIETDEKVDPNDEAKVVADNTTPKKRKRGRPPKLQTPVGQGSKSSEQPIWSPDDSLPLASMLASATKGAKRNSLGASEKAGSTTTSKKRGPKPKASKAVMKGKMTPITNFFSPKSNDTQKQSSKEELASVAAIEDDSIGGRTTTKTATATPGETSKEKKGSNDNNGIEMEQNNFQDSETEAVAEGGGKESPLAAPEATLSKAEPDVGTSIIKEDATEKGLETMEKERNKLQATTRPSRKRKMTAKAAETAELIAIKVQKKRRGSNESDVVTEGSPVVVKKTKASESLSTDITSDVLSGSENNGGTSSPPNDPTTKASIVGAAKRAAAAVASFSFFSTKSKSGEEMGTDSEAFNIPAQETALADKSDLKLNKLSSTTTDQTKCEVSKIDPTTIVTSVTGSSTKVSDSIKSETSEAKMQTVPPNSNIGEANVNNATNNIEIAKTSTEHNKSSFAIERNKDNQTSVSKGNLPFTKPESCLENTDHQGKEPIDPASDVMKNSSPQSKIQETLVVEGNSHEETKAGLSTNDAGNLSSSGGELLNRTEVHESTSVTESITASTNDDSHDKIDGGNDSAGKDIRQSDVVENLRKDSETPEEEGLKTSADQDSQSKITPESSVGSNVNETVHKSNATPSNDEQAHAEIPISDVLPEAVKEKKEIAGVNINQPSVTKKEMAGSLSEKREKDRTQNLVNEVDIDGNLLEPNPNDSNISRNVEGSSGQQISTALLKSEEQMVKDASDQAKPLILENTELESSCSKEASAEMAGNSTNNLAKTSGADSKPRPPVEETQQLQDVEDTKPGAPEGSVRSNGYSTATKVAELSEVEYQTTSVGNDSSLEKSQALDESQHDTSNIDSESSKIIENQSSSTTLTGAKVADSNNIATNNSLGTGKLGVQEAANNSNTDVLESNMVATALQSSDNVMSKEDEAKEIVMEVNDEKSSSSSISNSHRIDSSVKATDPNENRGHDVSVEVGSNDDKLQVGICQDQISQSKSGKQEPDNTPNEEEEKSIRQNTSEGDTEPKLSDDDELKSNKEDQGPLPEQDNGSSSQAEFKSFPVASVEDGTDLGIVKERKALDTSTEDGTENYLKSAEIANTTEKEESKVNVDSSQADEMMIVDNAEDDAQNPARKDVRDIVDSLLISVESRVIDTISDSTNMDIDTPLAQKKEGVSAEIKSNDDENEDHPMTITSASAESTSKEPDSVEMDGATEVTIQSEDDVSTSQEETKVVWVAMSKASRKSKSVKEKCNFIGYDENKLDRVKMLLYTTGSQIHRGRGFERIFGMYWDAIRLRLSGPLNRSTSERCDEAISAFLKSRKLRRIHNKFVMSIMRRLLKSRVPYSEISEHVPEKWQDRVKVPEIVTTKKKTKKKTITFYDGLENDLLRITDVPHFDNTTPYKEKWELPFIDEIEEDKQTPQKGPAVPIASSCIPGALVVDPMVRDTVDASGMKISDNAMWLLTVAMKEHIKNILNDSIEYKKGLKKGELFPQAIHQPNVLASYSNKNRKVTKGRTSAASLENGRKKMISSIDLFAALNMLPSGKPSSIGGSVSRISLEQTFLSGFNSIPSYYTGNVFQDVQSFISNEIIEEAKNKKPEEKKAKVSQIKSTEMQAAKNKQTKPASQQKDNSKTPSKDTVPIDTPISSLESPPLTSNLSPAIVQTPPKIDSSKLVTDEKSDAVPLKDSSTGSSEGVAKASEVAESQTTQIEKPAQAVTAGSLKSGAGRGAKNLAALMARATESTNNEKNESTEDGEKSKDGKTTPPVSTLKSETTNSNIAKSDTQESSQSISSKIPIKESESKPESTAGTTTTETAEIATNKEQFPIPPRQPVAPVRRGKGKGFGSKDLAAMRARSMTAQTDGENDQNPTDETK